MEWGDLRAKLAERGHVLPERHEFLGIVKRHREFYAVLQRKKFEEGLTPEQAAADPEVLAEGQKCGGVIVTLILVGMIACAITEIWDLISRVKDMI